MGKYESHSALDAPKNSDMKINTSQKPYFRNRSTGSLLLLFFFYLFIYFLLWKPRYLKHGPWIFSFFDLLSQTVKCAALFLVNTFDNSLWISNTTVLVNATVSCLSCLLLLSITLTVPPFQHDGRTPIMEIVRNNAMDMVKVLIYATDDRKIWEAKETTLVDLTLQDNEGKSVIHHCVQNREVGLCL